MTDPISRSDTKAAIKARVKRYELTAPNSFEHGVYQGLKMALNEVCALDSLPALDGDGKWEKEIKSLIDDYQTSLKQGISKLDTGEEMLRLVLQDLEKIRDKVIRGAGSAGGGQ